jgi:RHS repeat-associated protein
VLERLSYDAWGKRRNADGTDDPAGSIASQTNRGFTGHEELDSVGLVHMNGRVYDPLLARFGTPDPITESPFSTQGWNRYSYVGNSPLNFTDPSGYCFMGCFWKPIFRAIGGLLAPELGQPRPDRRGGHLHTGKADACAAKSRDATDHATRSLTGGRVRAPYVARIPCGAFGSQESVTYTDRRPVHSSTRLPTCPQRLTIADVRDGSWSTST